MVVHVIPCSIIGTPPYVPDISSPTDVSNFDVDDLMEPRAAVNILILICTFFHIRNKYIRNMSSKESSP